MKKISMAFMAAILTLSTTSLLAAEEASTETAQQTTAEAAVENTAASTAEEKTEEAAVEKEQTETTAEDVKDTDDTSEAVEAEADNTADEDSAVAEETEIEIEEEAEEETEAEEEEEYDEDTYGPEAPIVWTSPIEAVAFSHKIHTMDAGLDCDSCHDDLFEMEAGAAAEKDDFVMETLYEGGYCGACHDGDMAFASDTRCAACHIGVMGAKRENEEAEDAGH